MRRDSRALRGTGEQEPLVEISEQRVIGAALSDADVVHFKGAPRASVPIGKALRHLDEGLALRSSVQTERNAASSRSHAVVEISINGVTMTFVDPRRLRAEMGDDADERPRQHQRESADINLSLMALKDCF